MMTSFLNTLKDALGVFYFFAWSATFYPQTILNFRRKSTTGLSHDFLAMAWIGFVAYATFTVGGYFSTSVRADYEKARGAPPPIEFADVAFATHAVIFSTVLCVQSIIYYPGWRIKRSIGIGVGATFVGILLAVGFASIDQFEWNSVMEFCGAIKVITSIFKHFPQAFSNYKHRSCTGFSWTMIVLDVAGSLGSFAQQGLRCIIEGSWEPYTGNLSKLALSVESFLFDMFFLLQFAVYRDKTDNDARLPYAAVDKLAR